MLVFGNNTPIGGPSGTLDNCCKFRTVLEIPIFGLVNLVQYMAVMVHYSISMKINFKAENIATGLCLINLEC